jgi:hypothetical protein
MNINDVLNLMTNQLNWKILTIHIDVNDISKYPNLPWKWDDLIKNSSVCTVDYWNIHDGTLSRESYGIDIAQLPGNLRKFIHEKHTGMIIREIIKKNIKLCRDTTHDTTYRFRPKFLYEYIGDLFDYPELWCWNCICLML